MAQGIGFRAADGGLSCIMGIGSEAWDHLFGAPRPKELHPFREIHGVHHAPSTPGNLLFHIHGLKRVTAPDQVKALLHTDLSLNDLLRRASNGLN